MSHTEKILSRLFHACSGMMFASGVFLAFLSLSVSASDQNLYSCTGKETLEGKYTDAYGSVQIQLKKNTVQVTGAGLFLNAKLPITTTGVQVKFGKTVAGTDFGDWGLFNRVTGRLQLESTDGVRGEMPTIHWRGDYVCSPAKPM